ncbi:bifunctional methylenetetrahydrofolate dehydrogenase/methenyltetrahydrofolate cyclohydrolase FolD [Jannaschia seohaensis]|uniref:Bifunctional protein FolD n=1 Tax=Jannaschia seohaensis TaxID=475081 RepID=A0A2Y9A5Q5_9RHOB|nr:bifunctional methylenetetrahydrofolate dehydrogenase/methenyltetrahydrofolate cyclohydrolase FolD [Jannaschia seohaensis]PWJ22510.1 methylenetetrahydrofolate dehydrogenase (NADP+)/methenyltetrahydrofolate cyclohydrolase [Jannaschia seohaensis]SSA38788.1 methylenetetrahydrofolate dehydrogenase (NADP+) / methenyltetrahydrofolate cyclohydrolase [Jannaschia seohaensis]
MTAEIIDGKAFAAGIREKVAAEVARVKAAGVTPGLAVILVGEDPASEVYVGHKHKATVAAGMESFEYRLPADVPEAELFALIDRLNADPAVHGILCQFPVPDHLDERRTVARIDPAKDVDGLSVVNAGLLATGGDALTPCTPLGCLMLLRDRLGDMSGLSAVVIGRSNLFGKPMAQLLLRENCTVTMAHSRTRDLDQVCRGADILVAAVGRAQMVKGDWVKPGATVIDVGITRVPHPDLPGKTRLVGDVDFAEAVEVAGAITPVPGGVGPMTIACLLANTLTACCRTHGLPAPEGLTA